MGKAKWIAVGGLVVAGTVWGISVAAEGMRGHGGFGGPGGPGFGPAPMEFSALDADGDGTLTVAEAKAAQTARFQEMDANNDGVVNAEEMSAQAMARIQERMAKGYARLLEWRDSDGDGALSQDELGSDMAERLFKRADANNDGQISQAEFDQARAHGKRGGRRGHGRDGG